MHTWPHLVNNSSLNAYKYSCCCFYVVVVAPGAWNIPLVTSNRYHPMNNSRIVPVVVAAAGAPFWFAIFCYSAAAAVAAAATAAAAATSHTLTHCYAGYAHTNALHIYTCTHTPKHSTSSTVADYIFFLLVTCVVYNLTQFNYIRIAVRYMYFGQNEERERDDLVRQLTKLFGYLNLLLYLLLCCPYNFFLLSVCLCVRACE